MLTALPEPSLAQPSDPPELRCRYVKRDLVGLLGITIDSRVFYRETEDDFCLITEAFDSYDTARKYCDLVSEALKEKLVATTKAENQASLDDWYDKNVKKKSEFQVFDKFVSIQPDAHEINHVWIGGGDAEVSGSNGVSGSGKTADNTTAGSSASGDRLGDTIDHVLRESEYIDNLRWLRYAFDNGVPCSKRVSNYFGIPDRMSDADALACINTVNSNSQADARHALRNWAYTPVGDDPEPHYDHVMRLNKRIFELIGEKESLDKQLEEASKEAGLQKIKSEAVDKLVEDLRAERQSLCGTLEKTRQSKKLTDRQIVAVTQENNVLTKSVGELKQEVETLRQHKSTLLLQLQDCKKRLLHQEYVINMQKNSFFAGSTSFLEFHPSPEDLEKLRFFMKRFNPLIMGYYGAEYLRAWQCVLAEKCGLTDYDPLANKPPSVSAGVDPGASSVSHTSRQAIINGNGKLRSVELPYVIIKAHDDAGVDSAMWLQEFLNNTETGRNIVANAIQESERCVGIVLDKIASGENPQEKVADSNS